MSSAQRSAFDALFWDGLTLALAAARLSRDEAEVMHLFVAAFSIHAAEIERPWWCWRRMR